MNQYQRLKLKLILKPFIGGILLGLFIEFVFYPIYKFPFSLILSLGIGFTFGLMLAIANLIHIRTVESKHSKSPEALKCSHIKELVLSIPYDKAFDLCLDAVRSLGRVKIEDADRIDGRIVAIKPTKVPLDWIYNQDRIIIELSKDDNKTAVKVKSELYPHPPSENYVDYGSNLENVEKILKFLQRSKPALQKSRPNNY